MTPAVDRSRTKKVTPLHDYPPQFRYFDMLVSAFVAVLLISNLVAPKFVAFGPLRFSGAQLLFPLTYIFGDIFTEVYGYAGSRRAIWNGFFASALLAIVSAVIVALPPSPDWPNQKAYETVLGLIPRLVIASLIAYWVGEFANSFIMARMKVWTNGKYLWTRTIGSTAVGQAVDTVLVMVLAFAGIMSNSDIIRAIISGYVGKVIYEAALTPVTYAVVNALKRAEGVDILDVDTDFNPFRGTMSAR
ncbi:MAG: queuosine precursor transporter [Bryobacteraceae bacterium]|nr:queuosine precursor transporter [Bryobacteraceae bacterium]